MDKSVVLAKIRKCLALSRSANEHEAAAALRQAQKLMALYGITASDVDLAEVSEAGARAGAVRRPALWENNLALHCARIFGCEVYFQVCPTAGYWVFVGVGAAPQVAQYACEVLLRQVRAARSAYIAAALKRCSRPTRTRRADIFCAAWVHTALGALAAFAGSEDDQARIARYMATLGPADDLSPTDRAGKLKNRDFDDQLAGARAGKSAELHRGVAGQPGGVAAITHQEK